MSPYAKAIFAAVSGGVVALLSTLLVQLTGDATLADLTQGQWISVVLATLAGAGITGVGTYTVPNAPVTGGTTL